MSRWVWPLGVALWVLLCNDVGSLCCVIVAVFVHIRTRLNDEINLQLSLLFVSSTCLNYTIILFSLVVPYFSSTVCCACVLLRMYTISVILSWE